MKNVSLLSLAAAISLGILLAGCGSPESSSPESSSPDTPGAATASKNQGNSDHQGSEPSAGMNSDMAKMKASLAKLDPADAASAEKQHFCPVSGKMLGTMGVPQKVSVNGQTVWICCSGCKDKLLADPDTYLAKLSNTP